MNIFRIILITSVVASLVACGGAEDRKAKYLEKAQESIDSGDYDKARIELKNVLQIDPKDDQAYFKLAEVFENKKNYRNAFRNYSKAADLKPDNAEYQAKLGQYHLILGNDVEAAEEKLNIIRAKDKENVHGLMLEAGIEAHRKNIDKAIILARKALDKDPSHVANAVFLSTMYSKKNDPVTALEILEDTAKHHKYNPSLMSKVAGLMLRMERYDDAEKVLKEMQEKEPDNYLSYINLAKFYIKTNQRDRAEEVLKAGITNKPEDVKRRMELISFVETDSGVSDAIPVTRRQISETENDSLLRMKLADLLVKDGNEEGAIKALNKLIELYKDDEMSIKARLALAEIHVKAGRLDEASAMVEEAYKISPNDADVNFSKAKISLRNNDIEQGIISLRSVIKDQPEKLGAYLLLSQAHIANGEPDQAKDVLLRAHQNNRGNLDNLLGLSRHYISTKNIAEAERVIDDYIRINDSNYDALSIKTSIANQSGNIADAKLYSAKLIEKYPEKANGYLQSIPAMLKEGKVDEALQLLDTGLTKTSENVQMLAMYTRLSLAAGKKDEAIARINKSISVNDEIMKYMLLSKVYSDNKDLAKASEVLDRGLQKHDDFEEAYIQRIKLHIAMGQNDSVIPLLIRGIESAKTKLRLQVTLAGMYEREDDLEDAIAIYREMVAEDAKNVIAMNNLAALLVIDAPEKKDIDEAMSIVENLTHVTKHAVKDTVAWVYYHAGKYDEAVKILKSVVAENQDVQVYNYHYGMVLHRVGDDSDARVYLEKAVQNANEFRGRDTAEKVLAEIS